VSRRAEIAATYGRIGRTYLRWAPSLLLLAVIVFVPLGLLHTLTVRADVSAFDLSSGVELATLAGAVLALAATGLIGEVFYTGAVAISLTHPHGGKPPPLTEIARMVNYKTLIAVDLIYGLLIAAGLLFFFVPGILAFVWLGLAAPAVEIEQHGIRAAFARSARLVRGKFLLVGAVLIPLEILGDAIVEAAAGLAHDLGHDSLLAEWLADVVANVAVTPFYAVAAVLLTVELIRQKGGGVELHSKPSK
jgi:hypothetical protein